MSRFWCYSVMIISICLFLTTASLALSEPETSVVCLSLVSKKLVERDPFFELLDFGSYILVPVNSLPKRLGIEVEYLRNQGLVVLSSTDRQRQIKLNLNQPKYFLGEKILWEQQPPIVFQGSFYVCMAVIEFLAQVKLEWDPNQQELIVYGEWASDLPEVKDKSDLAEVEELSDVLESNFEGLSLFSYLATTEYQLNNKGEKIYIEDLQLRADGRVGAWSTTLGGKIRRDFLTGVSDAKLDFVRATYHQDHHLIILGDSSFELAETIGKQELRGFLYLYPDCQVQNEQLITTTITGVAEPGDVVTLFVNDLQLKSVVLSAGETSYAFEQIPLLIKRINLVKILIENTNKKEELISRVTADPRILPEAERQYLVVYGQYRELEETLWQGMLGGFRTRWGLTDKFTVTTEAVRFISEDSQYGMSFGTGLKLDEDLMLFGNWFTGGNEKKLVQGGEVSLRQSFMNGYLELAGFYLPSELGEYLLVKSGTGYTLLSEWNLNKNWSLLINGEQNNALPGMEEYQLQQESARLGYTWGESGKHSLTGTFKKKNLLFQDNELGMTIFEDSESFLGEYQFRKSGNFLKNQLSYLNTDYLSNNGELLTNINILNGYSEMLFSVNPSLWCGLSFDGNQTWVKQELSSMELSSEGQFKYLWGKNSLIASGSGKWQNHSESNQLELFELKFFGIGQFELSPKLNWENKLSLIDNRFLGRYLTARMKFNYSLNQNQTSLTGWLEYNTPYTENASSLWQGGLGIRHQFGNGLNLSLQAEHLSEDPWGVTQTNLFSLTLSQSIGFVNKKAYSFDYTEAENLAFVTGVVYLDENGSGKYEPGEETLPEIEMKMDGRIIKTDQHGKYIFHNLESGLHKVGFNFKKLDADYTPLLKEQLFKVKENQNFNLDFGLTINGVISGRFFIDRNANGVLDVDEKGLSLVGVELDGGKYKVFSDLDGTFMFENIPLGVHQLVIISDTLSEEMSLNEQGKLEIRITKEHLDHDNLIFPIVYRSF